MGLKNNQKVTRIVELILIILIIFVITAIGYLLLNKNKSSFSAVNKEVTFSGTINHVSDCYFVIGGSGCTWVVNNITVDWSGGSSPDALEKSGSVKGSLAINNFTGLGVDVNTNSDIGKKVEVYGKISSPNHVTLFGKQSYYIKVL
jgi:hypothetical protein